MAHQRTHETVELLQAMIRNECTNDGTADSGHETRNTDTLEAFLDNTGLPIHRYERTEGRRSIVTRIEGSDSNAPSLMLMGHTDVVTVDPSGWRHDPFGGELIDDEVWGRGAVDMLNLTASMAVAFRHLATSGFRPRGDLIYYAVADEESGSAHGARWMADHHPEAIRADFVLTENGGLHSGASQAPSIGVNIGEKGVAWRRLRIHTDLLTNAGYRRTVRAGSRWANPRCRAQFRRVRVVGLLTVSPDRRRPFDQPHKRVGAAAPRLTTVRLTTPP